MVAPSPEPGGAAGPCPRCGGTGFESREVDGLRVARPCACRSVRRDALRVDAARIPERYLHCDLNSFQTLNVPSLDNALLTCWEAANRYAQDRARRGLLLMGPCGVGKTHLGVGLLRVLMTQYGVSGLFAEFYDLLRRLQESYDRRSSQATAEILRPTLEAEVLLLDDLGATRMTAWARDTLGQIINERYNRRLFTVITTNRDTAPPKGQESLEDRIGVRLASRLAEMCRTLRIDSADYRRVIASADHHQS